MLWKAAEFDAHREQENLLNVFGLQGQEIPSEWT